MSAFFDFLMAKDKAELVKDLMATVKENCALRDKVGALQHEIFWMKVRERDDSAPPDVRPDVV